ncbi:FtsX-like permease family protein [Alteromonas lipolytica]|uniref:ABC3 transporter permease C-terminal domain-containing protein n=1 Tax=Alteromonas lipolytica TaxID=1856405 RepID=A0A1E8FK71_9ALTE|nr:FtsX-like permease family protein [Alteromonas lipolytica]OFI36349.1 hypothetical protein BFC17_00270 [Alteromonas lipolytica]GGF70607.1 hypothetical protein GCM10011338_23480 [Alteromonas lipolytica]
MSSLYLALLAQLATYKKRLWEPLLIVVAIFIASAGLTAVTLINTGASAQLNQLAIGDITVSLQVTAKSARSSVTRADYAGLRRQGFDYLVAYTITPDGGIAVDSLALLSRLPAAGTQGDSGLMSSVARQGYQDLNQFYQNTVTPGSYALAGLAIVAELSPQSLQQLQAALPAHLQIFPLTIKPSGSNLTDSFSLNLWAMGALMLLVSVFIVFNALNLLLAARTPLLIKLRQLGISQPVLLQVLLLEMWGLASLGSCFGVLAGAALITKISPALSKIYQFLLDGQFNHGQLSLLTLLLVALGLSLLAVLAMGVIVHSRLRRCLANRSNQVAAFSARFNQRYRFILLLIIGLVMLAAPLIASQLQALLYIGVVLIVGCATVILFMPALLRWLAAKISAVRPLWHWSVHNAVALSQRTKLAACAFFIALTANVGMNVMVDSFRGATEQWLNQRLFAPVYVYTDFAGDLSQQPDVPIPLLARYGKDVRIAGQLTELRSFPEGAQFQSRLLLDEVAADAWSEFYARQGVFINQQLANRKAFRVGDTLAIPGETGLTERKIIGIYPDYGNPKAQVLLPESALITNHEQVSAYAAFANVQQKEALGSWLSVVAPGSRLIAREDLIEQSMLVFSRTFMTTDMLNLVTMLVAALSFFVSITLLVMDIKPQLLLLRSVGVSAWRIKLSLFSQYCFIAVSCALLALPFALLLAWLLVNKVNRFAFHWTYPLMLDPLIILQSLLIGLGVLLVLMALPLGRLEARFYSQQGAL